MLRAKAAIKDMTVSRVPPASSRFLAHNSPSGNQSSIGNQARLRRLSHVAPQLQCKLTVGAVNDPLEAEADRVADQVMRMPDPDVSVSSGAPQISRKCAACEEEDKKVHAKPNGTAALPGEAPPIVHQVLSSSGQPLDTATRAFFEPRFGADFSGVRVHSDAAAADSAGAINARAYTVGGQIVLGAGAKHGANPLLAHELAHVVQQGGGSTPGQGYWVEPSQTTARSIPPCRGGQAMACFLLVTAIGRSTSCYGLAVEAAKAVVNALGGCTVNDSCTVLATKIAAIAAEIAARVALDTTCFKGGDTGHRQQVQDKIVMLNTCWRFFAHSGIDCSGLAGRSRGRSSRCRCCCCGSSRHRSGDRGSSGCSSGTDRSGSRRR